MLISINKRILHILKYNHVFFFLPSNRITHDGMMCLADVLKSNTTLEVLDLSFNRIENAGAKYLSETLASHNRSLRALVWFYI